MQRREVEPSDQLQGVVGLDATGAVDLELGVGGDGDGLGGALEDGAGGAAEDQCGPRGGDNAPDAFVQRVEAGSGVARGDPRDQNGVTGDHGAEDGAEARRHGDRQVGVQGENDVARRGGDGASGAEGWGSIGAGPGQPVAAGVEGRQGQVKVGRGVNGEGPGATEDLDLVAWLDLEGLVPGVLHRQFGNLTAPIHVATRRVPVGGSVFENQNVAGSGQRRHGTSG